MFNSSHLIQFSTSVFRQVVVNGMQMQSPASQITTTNLFNCAKLHEAFIKENMSHII